MLRAFQWHRRPAAGAHPTLVRPPHPRTPARPAGPLEAAPPARVRARIRPHRLRLLAAPRASRDRRVGRAASSVGLHACVVHTMTRALALVLMASSTIRASPVTVKSGDGSLALSFEGAAITGISLGGATHTQPSGGNNPAFSLAEFSSGAAGPPANSSRNMAANGDFSVVDADPSHAQGWNSSPDTCPLGYTRVTNHQYTRAGHAAAIMVTTPNATARAGAQHVWTAPPGKPLDADTVILSGWSKALEDDGGGGDYALYVDLIYADGTPQWGSRADFTSGPHDWEYKYHMISLEKPVKEMTIYCLYRGRKGSVLFDSVSVGLPASGSATSAFVGESYTVAGQNNLSAVTVHAAKRSAVATLQYNVTATFHARSDHIRLDGAVLVSSTSAGGAVPDRAVSLSFAVPVAAPGWSLWTDTDTSVTIGTEREYAGQSQTLTGSPNPIDLYPFATMTSPGGTEGIAVGVPMEDIVYVQRTHFVTETSSLIITFDFGLTNRSNVFPSMGSFTVLLYALNRPQDGFRGALQQCVASQHPHRLVPANVALANAS